MLSIESTMGIAQRLPILAYGSLLWAIKRRIVKERNTNRLCHCVQTEFHLLSSAGFRLNLGDSTHSFGAVVLDGAEELTNEAKLQR
jgi:hypothetical protein